MYLEPTVSETKARQALCPRRSPLARWFFGRGPVLERVELLHMPFHLFEARFVPGDSQQPAGTQPRRMFVGIDALLGEAMPLAGELFEALSAGELFESASPGSPQAAEPPDESHPPACAPQLTAQQARPMAERFARGLVLQWAMRLKTRERLAGLVDRGLIFYPVWVGYLRRGNRYDFRAVDGLSGEPWGGKLRRMVLRAFRRLESPERPAGPVTEPRERESH